MNLDITIGGTSTIQWPFTGSSATKLFKNFQDFITMAVTIEDKKKITHEDIPVFSFASLDKIRKDLLDQGYSDEEADSTILGLSELPEYARNQGDKKSRS